MWRLLRFLSRRISGIFLFIWIAISLFIYLIHLSSISSIHQAHSGKTVGSSSSIQLQKLYLPTIIQEDTPQSCHYPLPYYKPSMKSVDSYKSINLVFYKKHKMSAAVGVARKRGWHTVRVARSYDDLISYISDDSFTIIFTSSKELSLFLLEQFVNQSNILALGIPGAYLFTGPKKEQFITYQAYLNKHGCSIESIKMMPSMFLLDDNAQCETFFNQLKTNNSNKKWILKNSRGYGGDQIQVIHNTTSLASRFGSCNNNRPFIIQEYIQDLLLLDNRKFDIRALIVIGSARPYMVFYHEGYLRVVIRPYDPEGSRDIHLSNTHVQALQPDFTPDKHFWSFDRFQEYLNDHHPDNNDFVHTKLIPYIKQVSLTVIKSGLHLLKRSSSTVQLLGIDLMVSNDWHIWFIESNNYPLWAQGGWMSQFITNMGEDLFDLAFQMRQEPKEFLLMSEGEWFKSWQLIWREKSHDHCGNDSFNACKVQF